MNDGQTDAALEQYKVIADCRSLGRADLHAHRRDRSPQRKVRSGAGSAEEGHAVVPDSLEVQYNIAVIDEAQGKYDDAIQILNSC